MGQREKKNFIKIGNGKNFIRLWSEDFVSEHVHVLEIGKRFVNVVCLGGEKSKGYAPDDCPICAKAKTHWDRRKEIQEDPDFKRSKKLKVEAEYEGKLGKALQTKQKTVVLAIYGKAIIERVDGKKVAVPEFEKEVKYLNITPPQWKKLTKKIFEDYDFMKSKDDLFNRNLCFLKEEKEGKKGTISEVQIIPSRKESPRPKAKNKEELPSLDDVFVYLDEEEAKKVLKEFLEASGDVDEDEEESDSSKSVEDDELDEDEPKKKKKRDEDDDEDDEDEEDEPKKKKHRDEDDDEGSDDDEDEDEEEEPKKKKKRDDDEEDSDDDEEDPPKKKKKDDEDEEEDDEPRKSKKHDDSEDF